MNSAPRFAPRTLAHAPSCRGIKVENRGAGAFQAARAAGYLRLIRNSSRFAPAFSFSASHFGASPRPDHVAPLWGSAHFSATLGFAALYFGFAAVRPAAAPASLRSCRLSRVTCKENRDLDRAPQARQLTEQYVPSQCASYPRARWRQHRGSLGRSWQFPPLSAWGAP